MHFTRETEQTCAHADLRKLCDFVNTYLYPRLHTDRTIIRSVAFENGTLICGS
jgi:hypothetical protein